MLHLICMELLTKLLHLMGRLRFFFFGGGGGGMEPASPNPDPILGQTICQ